MKGCLKYCSHKGLIILSAFFFISINVFSQTALLDKRVNLKIKNGEIYDVLIEIGNQTDINFSYNSSLIPHNRNVKIIKSNIKVKDALDYIFQDPTVCFEEIGNHIVIHKKKEALKKLELISGEQESDDYFVIKGKIVDKDTYEPLAFANVSILGQPVGTVSNIDGNFSIKLSSKHKIDSLGFTYMGYQNSFVPIKSLLPYDNLIILERDVISIQEVIIRGIDPKFIVQLAIEAIADNYSLSPEEHTSFYREIVKKNQEYTSVTEAILNIHKSPYDHASNDQIKVYKSRNSVDPMQDTVIMKIKAGLNTVLLLDIVKNPVTFMEAALIKKYSYRLEDVVRYDESTSYKIAFSPKFIESYPQFDGFIYIDVNTMAIKGAEFSFNQKNLKNRESSFIVRKSRSVKVRPISASYEVRYRMIDGFNRLSLVRSEIAFKVRKKNKLVSNTFTTTIEMVVNDIDVNSTERFRKRETNNTRSILVDQTHEYDDEFWENYNFIRPDAPLEDAIIKINKKLELTKKAN